MLDQEEPIDDGWIKRAKNGDNVAFKYLYHEYYPYVYRNLEKHLRWSDEGRLRTLIDDVFTHAWKNLNKQDENQNFLGWLITMGKHLAIDDRRKRNTRESHEQAILEGSVLYAKHIDDPENVVIAQEELQEVVEASQELSEVERLCLFLSVCGFPLSEIVALVKKDLEVKLQERSVRTYISNARRKLRHLMHLQRERSKNNC